MEKNQFHEAILAEVNTLIEKGKKRITVLMPAGSGRALIAGGIVKSLHLTSLMLVPYHMLGASLLQRKKELFGDESVSILALSDYLNKQKNNNECKHQKPIGLFILCGTTAKEREIIAQLIPKDAIVVSIGSDTRTWEMQYANTTVFPFECNVFSSETLIDIRDLIIAPESERQIIVDQIADKKSKQDQLIYTMRVAPFNASSNAPKEELDYLREEIKERDRVIAKKEEELDVLKTLLASTGIPVEGLKKSIDLIGKIKLQYKNEDPEINNERVAKAIAEQNQNLFDQYVTPFSRQYYTSLIEASITKAVWDKLCKESQNCLITAKIEFQSMVNTGDASLDYSGVCILASKALDIEMSKRFFHNYVLYLRRTCEQTHWPNSLLDKDGNLLTDDKFTLGSVRHAVGIDAKGTIKNRYVYRMFLQYANAELYDSSFPRSEVDNHLKKCIESVETVREKFRNPAAHRMSLNQVTAKECFDYLVDTYKKLKEILEVMI